MGTGLVVLGIVVFAALVAVVTVIGLRNGIVSGKNRVKRAWADVITWERKKLKVIPAIEEMVKQHQAYEGGVLEKLTALRTSVVRLSDNDVNVRQLQETAQHSQALLSGLRMTMEAYPALKTSELYAGWMRELSEAEDNIAAAISVFNGTVQRFNDSIQEWPGSAINSRYNREQSVETFSDSAAEAGFEYRPGIGK